MLERILKVRGLKALDVVEVIPDKDEKFDFRTTKIVEKVVEKLSKSNKI